MYSKLQELILYIADSSLTDPDFGMVKLNKILFDADFTAFRLRGESITGEEYQKLPQGPAARKLKPAVEEARRNGELLLKTVPRGPYEQQRVIALREPNLGLFDAFEISVVDESIRQFWGMSASEVSDKSHEFLGWQLMELGETIPYETAYMSLRPATEAEARFALTLP